MKKFSLVALFPLLAVMLSFSSTVSGQTLVYSESFIGGATPTTQCTNWTSYLATLLSTYSYTGFKMSGSNDPTGIQCTNATVAAAVAAALRTGTAYTGSSDGYTWMVGTGCGSGCGGPIVELTATGGTCGCSSGYTIRPAIANSNWGGINTTTCGAASQTLTLTFFYIPPFTASPTSLSFGGVTTSTYSSVMTSSVSVSGLTAGGSLTITPPSGFEVSLNGTTWFSSATTYSYSGTAVSALPIYVRFYPSTATFYSGTITVSGGGMATPGTIAVSGTGAAACSSAPTAGTAAISPSSGTATTPFSLSLTGTTVTGGLTYQWQSSTSPSAGFTNISGATNPTYSFTGISTNMYYRAVVTCPSYPSSNSSPAGALYMLTLPFTGAVQTYTVPCGVNSLTVDVQGAKGGYGAYSYARGGYGGRTQATLAVTPGQVLYINIGGAGGNGSSSAGGSAGFNGGALGYTYGGGSGGASDIRIGGTALSNRVIVAGGGGGGGYDYSNTDWDKGGAGGDLIGEKGWGANSNTNSYGGLGGTQTAGGAGSTYTTPTGFAGAIGLGGAGGFYGGGGGGGYYGGGGGCYGGGGGGSSYADPLLSSSVTYTSGFNSGANGVVTLIGAGSGLVTTAGSMAFGTVTTGTLSSVMTTTLSATAATAGGSLTITPPTGFQVSLNSTTWSSTPLTYTYTGTSFTGVVVYVRFNPTSIATYTGTLDITGGVPFCGISLSGVGAPACTGTPTTGTAWISPPVGSSTTTFSAGLLGGSVAGGLLYQWQSSSSPTSGFTNITGATNTTYSFTGISSNLYLQVVVTCPTFTPAISNTVAATIATPLGYTGAIGRYVVPAGVTSLNIITKGAQGGSTNGGYLAPGGLGAIMSGNFAVTPGQVLKYIVGQQPASATYTGGGGGGSFVWDSATNTPLIISGGGGGAGYYGSLSQSTGINAVTAANGTSGGANDGGGGVGGYGATATSGSPYASGGAGWFSDGINSNYFGCSYNSTGGQRPSAGGAGGVFGGSLGSNGPGGFGGGGGSQGYCSYLGGGGGGGYSGGAPGNAAAWPGGGGGSLNTGTSQANSVGNSGNGSVTFTPLGDCVTPFSQATSFSYSSTLYTINASFANPVPAPMGYLVLMTTANVAPTAPDNGTTYPLGDASLGGVVVSNSASTSFSLTGMTPETKRYFWIYAYNTMCANGPRYLTTSPLRDSAATQNCSLSGVRTIGPGGNYPTIAAALAEANVYGVHGTLALELKTTYTGETYPIQLNSTYPCLSATNNIVIRPQGAMTLSASYAGPLFNFDNARYITIDGRVGSAGTTQALTIVNTNTSYPVISFVNDAMYDTVKYCIVKSPNISTATSSNQMGAICFGSTSKIYGNDYNTIDNCDITSNGSTLCTGIYSYGSSTKENSYNTISNCNIYDYYYTSATNFGIWLNSYNNNWTIKGNRFYQTASRSYVSGYNNGAIYISPGTTGMSSGFNISNNIIGYATKTGTGTYTTTSSTSDYFRAIWTSVGVDEPTTIYGNTITALNISEANSSTTGGGAMTGIYHVGGSANIDSNVIGAGTGTGAITASMYYSGTVVGISTSASNPTLLTPAIVNIRKNVIGSITANNYSTTYGASVHAIQASQNASVVISNNIIGSTTTANSIQASANTTSASYAQYVYGINSQITTTIVTPPVISNNIVANLYGAGAYSGNMVAGIVHANGAVGVTIKGNTVYNISGATSNTVFSTQLGVTGITCVPSSTTPTALIDSNTVYNIENTSTAAYYTHVAGILFANATDATISRNKVYGIKNQSTYNGGTSAPPTATGLFIYGAGGSSTNILTVVNNMVTLGTGQTTNTSFSGIMAYGSSSSLYRIYHNTVLIEGTALAGATNHTAAFHRGGYNTTNTNTIDVRNNIFVNNRTNSSGTAVHYAIANGVNYSASSTGWSSDYNLLNAANTANVGWFTGVARTFATWKTSALADFNSGSAGALTFTNSSIGDLHISMGTTANMVESHGTSLPSVNTDYDNQARPGGGGTANGGGFAPDLGADEFDGNPLDNIPPSITYTPLLAACGTGNRTFTATLADPAGIPTSGTLTPRVYYRKNSGTWYSSAGSLTSGTATNGVWTFTVVASDMGGLALGNTVQYFVVAQDNNAYVGSNTSGLQAGNVNSISTYPTTAALSYNVMPNLGGIYSVGSGGDYSTITAAVTAYNAACLSGPVTFNLISTTYPSETYPIQINGNSFASATNTLTIKPAAGIAATVNGPASPSSIFKLQDAKWVILDGVKSGGANLTLNSTYTSTFANIWLASTNATISGCRNISLKNMDIVGGSNSVSDAYGILASYYNGTGSPTTSSGIDNDSITVQGNNISKCYYGIYLQGNNVVSAGGYDSWLISNNNIGPATSSSTTNIYYSAIYMSNVIGPKITGNTIQNIGVSTISNYIRAINLTSNVNNAEISRNTIKNISANYGNDHSAPVCAIYLGSSVLNCSVLSNVITNVENTYSSGSGAACGIMVSTSQYVSNILIANNMISKILAKGWSSYNYFPSGIHLYSSTGGVKIYHNSINLYGNYPGYSGATGSANIMISTSYNNIDVRNNILLNTLDNSNSGTDKGYAIYSNQGSAGTFSYIDYNDYYVSSPNVMGYLSSDRTSLSAMQTGFGGNTHSISTLPSVIDTVNLRLQVVPTNVQFLVGTQLTQVPRDIDDTLRSLTNPVLGAHEVRIPQCNTVTLNAGTLSPVTPVLCTEGMTNIIVNGATAALNLTYQWLSSEDSTTWTAITDANSKNYAMSTPINGTTYYRLRLGCALDPTRKDSSTVKVVVNPSKILGTPVVCVGSVTTMSDTTVGGTWSSSSTGIATINASTGAMSGITAGSARITYTLTSSGCYTSRAVTVNPLPANILGSQNVCEGSTTLLLNPTGTGTWVSGNLPVATIATSGLVSGLTAGLSNVSYVLSTGCLRSVAVSVNPVPVMSITPSSAATVCLGDMASFKATGHLPGFTLLSQNFNSGLGSWQTTKVSGAASSAWQVYPTGYSSVTGDGTPMLASTPEVEGGGNNILTSPSFSTVGYDSATLTFNQDIISVDMDDIEVSIEYSTNGGSSWTLLLDQLGAIDNPGAWSASSPEVVKALPAGALNQPDVKLRWKYNTTFGYYWAIDNIAVKAILPEPTYAWTAFGPATGLSCTSCDSVNVTPTLAGINLYSVTATTASGCLSTGGLTSVLVNTPPVAIGGIKTVCEGVTTTLTNASFGGSWSSGDVGKATVNSLTGIVTGVGAGTVDITYTMPTGCRSFTVVTVHATPAPLTGVKQVCTGFTTGLSTLSTDGTWSSGASAIASVDATGVVSGSTSGVAPISYTNLNNCTITDNVTVNQYPAVITASTFHVCEGQSINLANTLVGGTWTSSNTAVATVTAGSGIVTGVAAAGTVPATATVSYTLLGGCARTQDITVDPTPLAISGTMEVCQTATTSLSSLTSGGTWSVASSFVASVDASSGDVTGINAGTTQVTYTLGTGCKTSANVTVNQLPADITGDMRVCEGFATTLYNAVGGGTWSSAQPATAGISALGIVNAVVAGTAEITYALPAGCYKSAIVTVNPQPSAIVGTKDVCQGSTTSLSSLPAGGTWTSSIPGIAAVDPANGVVTGSSSNSGTATITYTLPEGCRVVTPATVNVLPAPIAGTLAVCEGSTTMAINTVPGGTWLLSNAHATISAGGLISGVTAGTANLIYMFSTGCSQAAVVTVNITPANIMGNTVICQNEVTTLSSTTPDGVWALGSAYIATANVVTGEMTGMNAGGTSVTYLMATGCKTTTNLVVNALPAPITGTMVVCEGSTVTVSSPTPGGTWTAANANISIDPSGAVNGITAGTTDVVYAYATGCSQSAIVTVNVTPAGITGLTEICETAVTTLASTTPGGSWSIGSSFIASIDASSGEIVGVNAGGTPVVYTLPTGCNTAASLVVNQLPAPIAGTLKVCESFETTLSNTVGGGTWVCNDPLIAGINAGGVVTANMAGTANITYAMSTGCAQSAVVTVNALPSAITGTFEVCQGLTASLSSSPAGGTWTSNASSPAVVDPATGIVTASMVASGVAPVTYTLPEGCQATADVLVHVLPAPITGVTSVCENATANVMNTSGGGVWSTTATGIASIGATSGTITGLGAGTAKITYALVTGCESTADITVMAAPAPITGPMQVCQGLITPLTSITPGGTWNSDLPGIASVSGLGEVSGVTAGYVNINYVLPTGCKQTALVTVNSLPVAYPVGGGGTYCAGGTGVNIGLLGSENSIFYQLYNGTTPIGTTVAGTGTAIGFGSQTAAGVYDVKAVNYTTGCESIMFGSATIAITPVVVPAVTLAIPGGTTLCGGSSATYNAAPVNGGTLPAYSWEVNGSLVPGATSASYSYVPLNGDVVKVTLTSNAACAFPGSAVDLVAMVVNTPVTPSATIVGPSSVCKGSSATMTVTPALGGAAPSLQWYKNGSMVPAATSTSYTFVPSAGDFVYCTMATSIACNTAPSVNSNTLSLLTNPVFVPTVGITASPGISVMYGTPVTFSTIVTGAGAAPTYQWFVNGVPIGGATNTSYTNSTLHNSDSVTCRVTATEICGNATFNSAIVSVKGQPSATVNVKGNNSDIRLTPNPNTGVFNVTGHITADDNETVYLEITNVLGQTVYAGSLIAKNGIVNGQVKLANDLASGMYLVSLKSTEDQYVLRFVLER